MNDPVLDNLVKSGTIKSYRYQRLNDSGFEGKPSANRNTEKLRLVFPDNKEIVLETFCSGVSEDTHLMISE